MKLLRNLKYLSKYDLRQLFESVVKHTLAETYGVGAVKSVAETHHAEPSDSAVCIPAKEGDACIPLSDSTKSQKAGKMSDWYQASNAEHNRIVGFVSSDPKPAVLHILQTDPRKLFSKHRKHFTTANAIFAVSHLNINTVEELIRFTPAQLFNIPRVGHLTLAYIREVLNKHGLSLADGVVAHKCGQTL